MVLKAKMQANFIHREFKYFCYLRKKNDTKNPKNQRFFPPLSFGSFCLYKGI